MNAERRVHNFTKDVPRLRPSRTPQHKPTICGLRSTPPPGTANPRRWRNRQCRRSTLSSARWFRHSVEPIGRHGLSWPGIRAVALRSAVVPAAQPVLAPQSLHASAAHRHAAPGSGHHLRVPISVTSRCRHRTLTYYHGFPRNCGTEFGGVSLPRGTAVALADPAGMPPVTLR